MKRFAEQTAKSCREIAAAIRLGKRPKETIEEIKKRHKEIGSEMANEVALMRFCAAIEDLMLAGEMSFRIEIYGFDAKVIDEPAGCVWRVTDSDGNLLFLSIESAKVLRFVLDELMQRDFVIEPDSIIHNVPITVSWTEFDDKKEPEK